MRCPKVKNTNAGGCTLYFVESEHIDHEMNYRPQRSCGKVMFSQACVKNSVHSWGSSVPACTTGHMTRVSLSRVSLSRGSLSRGVTVQGGLCLGCLCPRGLCLGVLCPERSLSMGLCPGDLCPGGVSVRETPWTETPSIR